MIADTHFGGMGWTPKDEIGAEILGITLGFVPAVSSLDVTTSDDVVAVPSWVPTG